MPFTLSTTFNKARNETTISAYDAADNFICNATATGKTARVKAELTKRVNSDASRIQRSELTGRLFHITDVPGLAVQALAFPTCMP